MPPKKKDTRPLYVFYITLTSGTEIRMSGYTDYRDAYEARNTIARLIRNNDDKLEFFLAGDDLILVAVNSVATLEVRKEKPE